VAKPGVKVVKDKKPGVTALRFSNPKYVELFREANGLA